MQSIDTQVAQLMTTLGERSGEITVVIAIIAVTILGTAVLRGLSHDDEGE